jgi:putative hemolysin
VDANELSARLPPARDDEPPSLRQDIIDELADHLACAKRREMLTTNDEARAEQRVLDKFGDPREVARKLWFLAM